jgi:predicted helicase
VTGVVHRVLRGYQVTRDKDSGIVNDPNDWCKEHKQPRYILDLLKRVVRVSIETMKIVRGLPALNEQSPPDRQRQSPR